MNSRNGFALVSALIMVVVLGLMAAFYFSLTRVEMSTSKSQVDSTTGFFSAEAGLNLRGEDIRRTFIGFNVPQGTSPNGVEPCVDGSAGTGDFACEQIQLNSRDITTYVIDDPANVFGGELIRVPQGETFGGLNAFEARYHVFSEAHNLRDIRPEALLEMVFRSRLVPVFQFAAFYDKDLEILPGPDMLLNGRVHANGDLYLNAGSSLEITGQVTVSQRVDSTGGDLYRRRKNTGDCGGTVHVDDADASTNPEPTVACSGLIPQAILDGWNGQIETGMERLEVPSFEIFEPGGGAYWDEADIRIALDLRGAQPAVIVAEENLVGNDIVADALRTSMLDTCINGDLGDPFSDPANRVYDASVPSALDGGQVAAVEWSDSFYNNREGSTITMLEVDVRALLSCLHDGATGAPLLDEIGKDIDDTSDGGLVVYLTVVGADSDSLNDYGVRIRNGADLAAHDDPLNPPPDLQGLTVVSDQAAYVMGDYNVDDGDWTPASFLVDSLNILSEGWEDDAGSASGSYGARDAATTEINAAFLAGTDTTGGVEGTAGQGIGAYNGGLENYPRFHEDWSGVTFSYSGSLVSFGNAQHVDGAWIYGGPYYEAPNRDWAYETRFNSAASLPPMSPRFVYLRQELFVRDFDR